MSHLNPIGVFDSGVGGLSVLRWIRAALPKEDLLYIADSVYAPYGNRGTAFIERRSIQLTGFLLEQKAKAVVVACNTATAASIATLRSTFSIPIVGIEPGVKPAMVKTKNGTIGILATTETLNSIKFNQLISRFSHDVKIVVRACPGLVERIEEADFAGKATRDLLRRNIQFLLEKGADTIVLGCTHYIFLEPLVKEIAGEHVEIIDTGAAVAREVCRRLGQENLLSNAEKPGSEIFWTSNTREETQRLIGRLWNRPVKVRPLPERISCLPSQEIHV